MPNHPNTFKLTVAAAVGVAFGLTGVGTTLASVGDRGEYASPEHLQSGFGPAGRPATTIATSEAGGQDNGYGSAALLQLGYGPAGPPSAR